MYYKSNGNCNIINRKEMQKRRVTWTRLKKAAIRKCYRAF